MYQVWKNDTTMINQLLADARNHPDYYPLKWEYLNYLAGRLFLIRNQPEVAHAYFEKAINFYESIPDGDWYLGKSYYFDKQYDLALASHKKSLKKAPDKRGILIEIGMTYARQGNVAEAKKIIEQIEAKKLEFDYGYIEYHQARIYAILGESQKAINLLDKAISKGFKYDLWITFDHDPDLMNLWDLPEYKRLMGKFE
jgi:tetratricopeptide (TPR) repeat protein